MFAFDKPTAPMALGRFEKALSRVYRFEMGTMSLCCYLERIDWTHKETYTVFRAGRKVHLQYAKLAKPKTTYYLCHTENGQQMGLVVPKIVYDAAVLPNKAIFVGVKDDSRELFEAIGLPQAVNYPQYDYTIGPFLTRQGALVCARPHNPNLQTVDDFEAEAFRRE